MCVLMNVAVVRLECVRVPGRVPVHNHKTINKRKMLEN